MSELDDLLEESRRLSGIDNVEALAVNDRARALAEASGDEASLARYFSNKTEVAFYESRYEDSLRAGFEAETIANNFGDIEVVANVHNYRAMVAAAQGDLLQAIELNEGVIERLDERTDTLGPLGLQALANSFSQLGYSLRKGGDRIRAEAMTDSALRVYRLIPGHTGILTAVVSWVISGLETGQVAQALERAVQVVDELSTQMGERVQLPPGQRENVNTFRAMLEGMQTGGIDPDRAFQAAQRRLPTERMPTLIRSGNRSFLAQSYLRSKDYSATLEVVDEELRQLETDGVKMFLPDLYLLRAEACHGLEDPIGESQALRAALRLEREVGAEQAHQKAAFNRMLREVERQSLEAENERHRQRELTVLNRKIDDLLLNTLPEPVVTELKANGRFEPRAFPSATILVGDIVGFSSASREAPASEVFAELNTLYAAIDRLADQRGLVRLKTVGDAYMVVAGLFDELPDPVDTLIDLARAASAYVAREGSRFVAMRWGLAQGPLMAGIVGTSRFAFDVFGHTVNLAFRLESAGRPQFLCAEASLVPHLGHETRAVTLKGVGTSELTWIPLSPLNSTS